MNRLMIDFETLDTDATGIILSAGIVVFSETQENIEGEYYHFHVGGQIAQGRTMSPETVLWWAETNPEEFRKLCVNGGAKLDDFVRDIKGLIKEYGIKEIWSRGSMDFLMLEDIMEESAPPFWMARDVRTLDSLGLAKMRENNHNAYADCINQVRYTREVLCQIENLQSAQSVED